MTVIDEYLKNIPDDFKAELERVRNIIHAEAPGAEECIGYGMPTIRLHGKNLIHFAAFKDHMSIFPTAQPIEELAEKLKPFKTSRGTIQFTCEKTIPTEIIKELVAIRMQAILSDNS